MAGVTGFSNFQTEVGRLVETFEKNFSAYQQSDYDETSLRNEFLNPLLEALGWDVSNRKGLAPHAREVRVEARGHGGARQRRADYEFRVDRQEKFICEAKRPREQLVQRYVFQAKNYAWNRDLPLAVLTDFEEFRIYIVGGRPDLGKPEHGEYKVWHYKQYPLIAQQMWDLFARDNVAAGSIEKLIESLPKKPLKGKARQQWLIKPDRTRAVDAEFLRFLDDVRRELASDLYRHNKKTIEAGPQLNEAVQRILDRILFLRICEDRDIDTGIRLESILESWLKSGDGENPLYPKPRSLPLVRDDDEAARRYGKPPRAPLYRAVVRHFRALDRRPPTHAPFFNGQLFKPHFSEDLEVSDDFLANFIRDLSADDSPYLFNSLPVEILGSVYERFIGKVVRPKGVGITVEDKPEVRKAGGVYYTPALHRQLHRGADGREIADRL